MWETEKEGKVHLSIVTNVADVGDLSLYVCCES